MVRLGIESYVNGVTCENFSILNNGKSPYLILKYPIYLKMMSKPVFLIAIMAVVMIGVMVPSVFAENYVHVDPLFSIDIPSGCIIDSELF
jgi:hypothetical protein